MNPNPCDTAVTSGACRTGAGDEAVAVQRRAIEHAPMLVRADYEPRLAEYLAASTTSAGS